MNSADENGWTALHFAASKGEPKLAELLLQYRANPNAKALFDDDAQSELKI